MYHSMKLASAVLTLAVVGCAGPGTVMPLADVPDAIQVAAGESLAMIVSAEGVQIYECRERKDAAGYEWAFVAPEAVLFGAHGNRIGLHYAGPRWEAVDGSKVAGRVKASVPAPAAGAIPWLLLDVVSVGAEGSFSRITSIQRVNTAGGVAPGPSCSPAEAGARARIPYTADYRFFAADE